MKTTHTPRLRAILIAAILLAIGTANGAAPEEGKPAAGPEVSHAKPADEKPAEPKAAAPAPGKPNPDSDTNKPRTSKLIEYLNRRNGPKKNGWFKELE